MNIIHLPTVDSTNEYLKKNYDELENYTFVSADYQTKGRGRNNREWKSENNNLLFSLLLLDKQLFNHYKELSIVTAYTVVEVLKQYNIEAKIKWPNDVFVNDKKICGILLESISKQEIECLIVGVGINANQKDFIGEYRVEPTSIYMEANNMVDIGDLKDKIYKQLINNIELIKSGKSFYEEMVKYDYLINKEVYIVINNIKEKVKIVGIDKNFNILVKNNDKIISLDSGEINFI